MLNEKSKLSMDFLLIKHQAKKAFEGAPGIW
jgi:hypothetical protein